MKALILAAGFGKRLQPITNTIPKSMVEVNGTPLLINALNNLTALGITDIGIVVGHMADYIKEKIGNEYKGARISYYENPRYLETNNVVSLHKAVDFCNDDMLMLECDIYYHKEMLEALMAGQGECSILVSPFNPETMDGSVILVEGDRALELILGKWQGKDFDYSQTRKTVNMYRFTKEFTAKYMPLIKWYVENMGEQSYYEKVLGSLMYLRECDIRIVEVPEEMWCEVDDASDLARARARFGEKEELVGSALQKVVVTMDEMISVIVPIFNASRTIHRCIDSILAQTYRSLEILLIDDGSFDDSGRIVDEYAKMDKRIKAFHKENGGISSARNYGLDRATGSWISFVDSDDWIEDTTYETILSKGAEPDLYVFGRSTDTPTHKRKRSPAETVVSIGNEEALKRLIVDNSIGYAVWDKLYDKNLFNGIRFPDGFNYEDTRITYQLLEKANKIVLLPDVLYHYMQYKGSIVHTQSLKNRLDHWTASLELFQAFSGKNEYRNACLLRCSISAIKAWGALWNAKSSEKEDEQKRINELAEFAKAHRDEIISGKYKPMIKNGIALVAKGGRHTMLLAYLMNSLCVMRVPMRLYH